MKSIPYPAFLRENYYVVSAVMKVAPSEAGREAS